MASFVRQCCLFLCGATALLGWEGDSELVMEGVLRVAQRNRITRYPDGAEESKVEKRTVLVTDEPVILSRSITLANNQVVLQKESLPHLRVSLGDEFLSLMGKRVKLYGNLTKPFDFFFRDDVEFDVSRALDWEWLQTHQSKTVPYEPEIVTLSGKMYEKTYPGPPEYMSIEPAPRRNPAHLGAGLGGVIDYSGRNFLPLPLGESPSFEEGVLQIGDQPETVMILALSEPIDVEKTSNEDDDFNETEKGVLEIQVVFSESMPTKSLWNQEITLRGSLFHAHTGHHRRRVLIMVNHWELSP
jgi:hypothetical protein